MLSFVSSTTHTVLTITICMTLIVLQVGSGIVSRQLQRVHFQSRAVRGIVGVHVGVVAYSITLQRSMVADAVVVVIDARPGDLIIHGQAWRGGGRRRMVSGPSSQERSRAMSLTTRTATARPACARVSPDCFEARRT